MPLKTASKFLEIFKKLSITFFICLRYTGVVLTGHAIALASTSQHIPHERSGAFEHT